MFSWLSPGVPARPRPGRYWDGFENQILPSLAAPSFPAHKAEPGLVPSPAQGSWQGDKQ